MYEFGTPQDARKFVVTHFRRDVEAFTALERGEWSQAYAFALDSEQYVIRFGEHLVDFLKDKVMAAYSSERLPIPAVREIGETGSGYFAVSKRAHGVALDALTEAGMHTALPALLDAIEACAGLDTSRGHGYGPWDQEQHAPYDSWPAALLAIAQEHHRAPWQEALARSEVGAEAFDRGVSRLQEIAAHLPDLRQIVHSDLLHNNVLIDGARVTAVIDWANSMYGDALYDQAWLVYWWPWYPQWKNINITDELKNRWQQQHIDVTGYQARLLAYQLHIGLDSIIYNAFRSRDEQLGQSARRVSELAAVEL